MHELIRDITFSILFAWLLGLGAHFFRQPLILAYLVAGFAIGPYGVGWVKSQESISTISELGLIFMLFMIGLEIDLKKIIRAGRVILFAAGGQLIGACVLGLAFFVAFTHQNPAGLLSTPLFLGLDDDSFPVAGNLEAAAARLLENPKTAALALRVIFRGDAPPGNLAAENPFPVRDFIGCANLVKREVFLELGGYEERYDFYTEEAEFCVRAMQHGYGIEAFPRVVVRHNHSPVTRNAALRARRFARNETLLILWYFPFPECWIGAVKILPGIIVRNAEMRPYWLSLTAGFIGALLAFCTWPRGQKKRMTRAQFDAWRKLPSAVQVVSGRPPIRTGGA